MIRKNTLLLLLALLALIQCTIIIPATDVKPKDSSVIAAPTAATTTASTAVPTVVPTSTATVTPAVAPTVLPGGYTLKTKVELAALSKDPQFIKQVALVREFWKINMSQKLGDLTAVEEQIVNGKNRRLTFNVITGKILKKVVITVYIQEWTSTLTVTATVPSIPGGIQNGDLNKIVFKKTPEPVKAPTPKPETPKAEVSKAEAPKKQALKEEDCKQDHLLKPEKPVVPQLKNGKSEDNVKPVIQTTQTIQNQAASSVPAKQQEQPLKIRVDSVKPAETIAVKQVPIAAKLVSNP